MKQWAAILAACLPMLAAAAGTRPNILFIMSDDHTAHAIGAYGGRLAPLNPTPTLDELAAEGVVMANVFCNNSVCSPSRASILTGQYSHVNSVRSLGGKVAEDKQTLPLEMRKAGYQTAIVGKWHLGIQPLAFGYYKVLKSQGKYHTLLDAHEAPLQPGHFGIRTEEWKLIFFYGVNDKPDKGSAPTPRAGSYTA